MTVRCSNRLPRVTVAVCHVAPVFLDAAATLDKACDLIAQAAQRSAQLVVFPESFIPGFPVWAALQAPMLSHDHFKAMVRNSIRIDGPEMDRLRMQARKHGIKVSIGFSESTEASVGCLWNSNVVIENDGAILIHHRKLIPTFYEKLIWAPGDGRGLRVIGTDIGRIGMLICGENTNPLARYSLIAQGEQLHLSTYPPIWPTRPSGGNGAYDLRRAIEIRAGAHAFEGKVFNIVSSGFVDGSLRAFVEGLGPSAANTLGETPKAVSMILDPTGTVRGDVLCEEEGMLIQELDLDECIEPKQFHDVAGYYNRFDIFKLTVDRSPLAPISYVGSDADLPTQLASPYVGDALTDEAA